VQKTLQGSYFITFEGVFRSSSIELVPTTVLNNVPGATANGANPENF
jgi:hypothetical protein